MGWRGRSSRFWPGRGPFSYLPPWQRPGWLYGRGACWWLLSPSTSETTLPRIPADYPIPVYSKEQEAQMLEQQSKILQSQLEAIKKRLEEIKK